MNYEIIDLSDYLDSAINILYYRFEGKEFVVVSNGKFIINIVDGEDARKLMEEIISKRSKK